MNPDKYGADDLIPHRPPMVMIDRLTHTGKNFAKGCLFIKGSNIFCDKFYFQEAGVIEFIAQTAAAYKGYLSLSGQKEVKQGYLVLIKNFIINSLPAVNSEIQSEIIIEDELLDYTILTGRALQNNLIIGEGEMRILIP